MPPLVVDTDAALILVQVDRREIAGLARVPAVQLLPPALEARALLHHLLEHGDIVGRDAVGRTIIQLAVDNWTFERLLTFDAEAAELEPEPDDEEDGPPVVIDLVRPKMVRRRQGLASGCVG